MEKDLSSSQKNGNRINWSTSTVTSKLVGKSSGQIWSQSYSEEIRSSLNQLSNGQEPEQVVYLHGEEAVVVEVGPRVHRC